MAMARLLMGVGSIRFGNVTGVEMKFRILAAALLGLAMATSASAETVRIAKTDCSRLVDYVAPPDVAFRPGVDVRGRKVVPAGGPQEPDLTKLVPEVIEFSIALNPLRGGAARFGETSLGTGVIRFDMKTRRATLNGQALSRSDSRELAAKCREILRQTK
jgi:hypothetical protein